MKQQTRWWIHPHVVLDRLFQNFTLKRVTNPNTNRQGYTEQQFVDVIASPPQTWSRTIRRHPTETRAPRINARTGTHRARYCWKQQSQLPACSGAATVLTETSWVQACPDLHYNHLSCRDTTHSWGGTHTYEHTRTLSDTHARNHTPMQSHTHTSKVTCTCTQSHINTRVHIYSTHTGAHTFNTQTCTHRQSVGAIWRGDL